MDNKDLKKFLYDKKINAEIITLKGTVITVEQASRELGVPENSFIKTITFASDSGPILVMVKGEDRIDTKKVEALVGEKVKMVPFGEVAKLIGYPAGGVPPIGTGLKTIIDPRVREMEYVYGGGGDEFHLLKITPDEILKFSNGTLADVRK